MKTMIKRQLQSIIDKYFYQGKIIIIYGARQVGKTTLIKLLINKNDNDTIFLNCDDPPVVETFTNISLAEIKLLIANKKNIFIDEAQRIRNIGLTLKLIADNFPEKQIVVSGSSSFDLTNEINEPLTGRKYELMLTPISVSELINHNDYLSLKSSLKYRIVYGMYPEVIMKHENAKKILLNLSLSYLYKDVFTWQRIRKPEIIQKLLKALALQIGSEVSYNEISNMLGISKDTVASYIQLLEQAFIIFRLSSFSRNLRTELKHKNKIYFWDTGVRNALLNNFIPFDDRQDNGSLWENFIIAERIKLNLNNDINANYYFWRTHQQQEVDFIEETENTIKAYEIKWNANKKVRISKKFTENYPEISINIINSKNFFEFLI